LNKSNESFDSLNKNLNLDTEDCLLPFLGSSRATCHEHLAMEENYSAASGSLILKLRDGK
jgi:hypothetical protein